MDCPNPYTTISISIAKIFASLCQGDLPSFGLRAISTQVVRNRMKSVKNIQKITKAMKMVASSKLRRYKQRQRILKGYGNHSLHCLVMSLACLHRQLYYVKVSMIVDDILKHVEYDAIRVVFNKFQSIVSFLPTMSTVLSPEVVEKESEMGGKLGELDSYEIEGAETKAEVLQNLTEFHFVCALFNACLENACSEQGARMSAMDSSSRNAGEMLDKLTLSYNRSRQASITTELIEIISGASALQSKA